MADAQPDPDQISRIIMLTFGTMEQGGPYWCYLAVKPSRYDEFKTAMASKKYNIQQFPQDGFGEVIVSGEGQLPPKDVTKKVASIFGIPIRELFADIDPKMTISKGIEIFSGKPAS